MIRLASIVAVLGLSAVTALAVPPQQQQQQQLPLRTPEQLQQNQIQDLVGTFYVSEVRTAVELTDDQFLKLGPLMKRFVTMRFNVAARREALSRRIDQLSAQSNLSEDDLSQLLTEKTQVDRNWGNMEVNLLEKLRPDLNTRQVTLFLRFNKRFFEERLPELIEKARAATAAVRSQQGLPQQRPNANDRGKAPQGSQSPDAFRGGKNR